MKLVFWAALFAAVLLIPPFFIVAWRLLRGPSSADRVVATDMLGLLRFPDVFTRMHAATTAGVVGSGGMMPGAGLAVGTWAIFMTAATGIFFLVSTVTLSGHILGRAAYLSGTPLCGQTVIDALHNVYERRPFDQPQETSGADAIAARPAPSRRE